MSGLNRDGANFMQGIVDRRRKTYLKRKNIKSIGVGKRVRNGKETNENCIVFEVIKKVKPVPKGQAIPKKIDGVPTDVREYEPIDVDEFEFSKPPKQAPAMMQAQVSQSVQAVPPPPAQSTTSKKTKKVGLLRIQKNVKFNPLKGAIPIKNPKARSTRVAVLGAIVYDSTTGKPYALTVCHGVHYSRKKKWFELTQSQKVWDSIADILPADEAKAMSKSVFIRNLQIRLNHMFAAQTLENHVNALASRPTSMLKKTSRGKFYLDLPVRQPPISTKKADEIGKVKRFDIRYDAALIEVNKGTRAYLPKIIGKSDEFVPLEPMVATEGMAVEMLGTHNFATGIVSSVGYVDRDGQEVRRVEIKVTKGQRTDGGDSGSIWVESSSKRPVAIHRGKKFRKFLISGRIVRVRYAFGHCLDDLSKKWKFQFNPVAKPRRQVAKLNKFEAALASMGNGFVAACHKPGEPFQLKKFDHKAKAKVEKPTTIIPKTGLALLARKKSDGAPANSTHCFWVDAQDQIHTGQLSGSLTVTRRTQCDDAMKTLFKPAAIALKDKMIVAYIDKSTSKVAIATSTDGKKWNTKVTRAKSCTAPALTVHSSFDKDGKVQQNLVLSWVAPLSRQQNVVAPKGNVRIGILNQVGKNYDLVQDLMVPDQTPTEFAPDLCATEETLCLAYTDLRNQFQLLEGVDIFNLRQVEFRNGRSGASFRRSAAAPSLLYCNDEVICARQIS